MRRLALQVKDDLQARNGGRHVLGARGGCRGRRRGRLPGVVATAACSNEDGDRERGGARHVRIVSRRVNEVSARSSRVFWGARRSLGLLFLDEQGGGDQPRHAGWRHAVAGASPRRTPRRLHARWLGVTERGRCGDDRAGRPHGRGHATLLGRRSYEGILGYWNTQDSPFTPALNNAGKYVASRTLSEPLRWPNSALLRGDVPEAVAQLRQQPGSDMIVMGERRADPDADRGSS